MNFTHDTKYTDIPKESFLRACTVEEGMVVLFQDGIEYGMAFFGTDGRCRNAEKNPDYKRAFDAYMDVIKYDLENVVKHKIIMDQGIKVKVLQDLGILTRPTCTTWPVKFNDTSGNNDWGGYHYEDGF